MKTMFRRFSLANDKRARILQTIARILCAGFGGLAIVSLIFLVAFIGGYFPWLLVGGIPLILVLVYYSFRYDMFGAIIFWLLSGGWGIYLLYRIIRGFNFSRFHPYLIFFVGLGTGILFFLSWYIENRGVNWEDAQWQKKRGKRSTSWEFSNEKK